MISNLKENISKLEKSKYAFLIQFIKFGIVGISNTLISYGIEMLCYYVLFVNVNWDEKIKIIVINVLAFAVSVTNSYYWNNRYVFSGEKKNWKGHLITYLKTAACYGVTGLLLAPAIKIWLNGFGWPYWVASLGALIITIPLNYILNKFWAFKKQRVTNDEE